MIPSYYHAPNTSEEHADGGDDRQPVAEVKGRANDRRRLSTCPSTMSSRPRGPRRQMQLRIGVVADRKDHLTSNPAAGLRSRTIRVASSPMRTVNSQHPGLG